MSTIALGDTVALRFDLGYIQDARYGNASLKGQFTCICPHGSYPYVPVEKLPELEEKYIQYAMDIGLIKEGDKYYNKFKQIKIANFTAFFLPGIEPEVGVASTLLQMFFFVFDDTVDNLVDHFQDRKEYSNFYLVIRTFIQLLNGTISLEEVPKTDFPRFRPLCQVLLAISTSIGKVDRTHFVDSMSEYLKASVWEHSDHIETTFPAKELYFFRRSLSIGSTPTIELYNIIRGIELRDEVRESPIFKYFYQQVAQHIFLVNDVFSLKKEIRLSEVDNFILLKQQKYSLQESFEKVVALANETLERVKDASRALMKVFPESSVKHFINSVHWLLDGQFYWYQRCDRYGAINYQLIRAKPHKKEIPQVHVKAAL